MNTNGHIERIVVNADFTESGSRAVERAAMLAAEHEASLQIVHVATSLTWSALKRLGFDGSEAVEPTPELQQQLDEAKALATSHGVTPEVKISKGGTAAQLVQEAEQVGADLLVVGASERRSIASDFVGTTAEKLIRPFGGDILVVRTAPRASYASALVAVALGPASRHVVQSALALSKGARIYLLHAFEPPPDPDGVSLGTGSKSIANYHLSTKKGAAKRLSDLLEQLEVPPGIHIETMLKQGKPAPEILLAAAQLKVDVVAVGKNMSALEQLFLGSATKDVVRATSSDILICAAH